MHSHIMFAHGQGIISTLSIGVLAGFSAVVCFIVAGAVGLRNAEAGKRTAKRLIIAGTVCILVAVFSPWIAETFHLP